MSGIRRAVSVLGALRTRARRGIGALSTPTGRDRLLRPSLHRCIVSGEEAGRWIHGWIVAGEPRLVARMGATEARILGEWRYRGGLFSARSQREAHTSSGIFPVTEEVLGRFAVTYWRSLEAVDLLGYWTSAYQGRLACDLPRLPLLTDLAGLEPFFFPAPWSAALEGRRVLVVHPFEATIRHQYESHRQGLFPGKAILPSFDLLTVAAPMTLAPATLGFGSWGDCFEALCARVLDLRFDVALLGCGAYGLPLGARIRQAGAVAIHLGGALQLLFGIRGQRWDRMARYPQLANEAWCRPSDAETPCALAHVDGAPYW